jgi:amino acid permease-like protein
VEPLVAPLLYLIFGNVVASTLQAEFGWSYDTWWVVAAVAAALIVFAFGWFGIRLSTGTGTVLGLFEILVFAALAVTLIAKAGDANTLSVFGTGFATAEGFGGFSGVIAGSVYTILAFIGFEAAAPLAEEAKDPRRTVRLAVVYSCLLIGLFYVLTTCAAAVFFGPEKFAEFPTSGNGNPWDGLARTAWGAGWVLVFLAVANSAIANANASANAATRTWFAMGRIRLLPRALEHVNPRSRWRSLKRGNPAWGPARRPCLASDQLCRAATKSAIPEAYASFEQPRHHGATSCLARFQTRRRSYKFHLSGGTVGLAARVQVGLDLGERPVVGEPASAEVLIDQRPLPWGGRLHLELPATRDPTLRNLEPLALANQPASTPVNSGGRLAQVTARSARLRAPRRPYSRAQKPVSTSIMSPIRSSLVSPGSTTSSLRPCAANAASRCSTLKRASRSWCSTTIVVACGSASSRVSLGRLPLTPAPTSVTTSATARPCPAAHAVSLATCRSRSARRLCEETRAYSTTRPPGGLPGVSTRIVPEGRRRAGTGMVPWRNQR